MSEDVSKVLECEAALPLTALIGPNIIISRSFDSPEAICLVWQCPATKARWRKKSAGNWLRLAFARCWAEGSCAGWCF